MRSPFASLREWWTQTKPEQDDSAVPNRAAFRAMGIKGRRGARLVKQRIGQIHDMDAHDEYLWLGQRVTGFFRPRLGRGAPYFSHQQARFLRVMRQEQGKIQRRRWLAKKIEARRAAQGIEPYTYDEGSQ